MIQNTGCFLNTIIKQRRRHRRLPPDLPSRFAGHSPCCRSPRFAPTFGILQYPEIAYTAMCRLFFLVTLHFLGLSLCFNLTKGTNRYYYPEIV